MALVAKAFQDIITFSRNSNGTYVNSNGYITNSAVSNYLGRSNEPENALWTKSNSFVQQNLAINSQDFDLWSLGAGVTVAANSTIAPDGTLTADRITFTAGGALEFVRRSATLTVGVVYTASVYAQTASGTPTFLFDSGNTTASTAQTPTAAWQRFTFTFTFSGANQWVDLESSGAGTIAFWGFQLVQGSVPGDYRATTSAALPCLYADYNGALRARKLCEDATAATTHRAQSNTVAFSATTYTDSVVLKAGERTWAYVRLGASGANVAAYFNLTTGAVGTVVGSTVASTVSLGNGWFRCIVTGTATAVTDYGISVFASPSDGGVTYTGDGSSGIYIADAQLNDGSAATAYWDNATGSATYAPRFDYDPATLAAKGLLMEESRTNLVTYSSQLDDASWSKLGLLAFGSGSIANATLSPDGTVSADQITEDTSLGIHLAYKNNSVTSGVTYTLSFWVKRAVGTRDLSIRMDSGAATVRSYVNLGTGAIIGSGAGHTVTVRAWGSYWFVTCTMTAAATAAATMGAEFYNGTTVTYTGDGTSALYVWGFQLETGAFATSYIPTVASQVTRAADLASVNTLSPWFNSAAGTLYAEFDVASTAGSSMGIAALDNGAANGYMFYKPTGLSNLSGYAGSFSASLGSISVNTIAKAAVAYDGVNNAGDLNAAAPVAITAGAVPTPTRLVLGGWWGGSPATGHLRRITYYPRRLTNAELQTLTTL